MTNEEVLEYLKNTNEGPYESVLMRISKEALGIVIDALEKQIPVKCECITKTWGTFHEEIWRCPKCHKDAIRGRFYCCDCGQRLSLITKKVDEK